MIVYGRHGRWIRLTNLKSFPLLNLVDIETILRWRVWFFQWFSGRNGGICCHYLWRVWGKPHWLRGMNEWKIGTELQSLWRGLSG